MAGRIFALLRIKLKPADREFVEKYLDDAGLFLFNQMSFLDQKHSVAVARILAAEEVKDNGFNQQQLIQAALLHDCGKVKGEIKWFLRPLVAVIRRWFPRRREKWGARGKSALSHALYVDRHHPSRGAYLAESLGLDPQVVSLIKRHHDPLVEDQDRELALLQFADRKG
ncbi:MAG: HD domain-containing protein [Firmicutes bacterium]|nr:HD domain-containing protein [Bacillota bacterium]